jgi:hypothetical protein
MDISILANEDGNFDPKGDVQWVWKDGAWFQADIGTNSISLPPEEFHIPGRPRVPSLLCHLW